MITLPAEPVDQHVVEYWDIDYERLTKVRLVYHVNTPWVKYEPERTGGADLVDDWMVYRDDSKYAEGRLCGWDAPKFITFGKRYFLTREEAVKVLRERLEGTLEHYRQKVRELQSTLKKLI